MRRNLLMVLLGLGAVAGFGSGFSRLYNGQGHFGPGLHGAHHAPWQRHVADTCAEAALRVYSGQSAVGPKQ